jgi:hypothetical protein
MKCLIIFSLIALAVTGSSSNFNDWLQLQIRVMTNQKSLNHHRIESRDRSASKKLPIQRSELDEWTAFKVSLSFIKYT